MAYSYDAGSTTPGHAGLIEITSVIRINSAIPSGGSTAGGTFKVEPGCALFGTAPVRLPTSALPSDHGASMGTPFLDGWTFSIPGWFWVPSGPDDCPSAAEQLKAAFSTLNGLLTLTLNKRGWATRRQIQAQTNGDIGAFEARHGTLLIPTRNFTIPMFAPDPLQYDADNLKTPTVTLGGSGTTTNLTNNGNAPTPFKVRFTGPMTNPALVRSVSGTPQIALTATITAGHWIEVGTNPAQSGGVYAVDDLGVNQYGVITTFSTAALTIPAGTTAWYVNSSGTTGASGVVVTYRDAWG